jgi:hypothetical protein
LQRYLVTYLPVDPARRATQTSNATHVRVFAVRFANSTDVAGVTPAAALRNRRWLDLGMIAIPTLQLPRAPHPAAPFPGADDAIPFGVAIEPLVHQRFVTCVVKHPNPRKPWNIDLVWNELAEFYSELAQELGSAASSFRF